MAVAAPPMLVKITSAISTCLGSRLSTSHSLSRTKGGKWSHHHIGAMSNLHVFTVLVRGKCLCAHACTHMHTCTHTCAHTGG